MADLKRTAFAGAAVEFSDVFKKHHADVRVAAAGPLEASLTAPEGMSTAGGAQSLQHIKLGPVEGEPGARGTAITVGRVDRKRWTASLRTYACLASMHRQRFGDRPFELDDGSYEAFFEKASAFFKAQGMTVEIEDQPATVVPPPAPPVFSTRTALLLVVGFVLLSLAIAALILRAHRG